MFTLSLVAAASLCTAQIDEARFTTDLTTIATQQSRCPGTPGYSKTVEFLDQQLRTLPGVTWRRQNFEAMVPVTRFATISLPDKQVERVYPFWPAGIRLNGTTPMGVTGRLIYCGNAEPTDIPLPDLHGKIAVIEAAAGENWTRVAQLGAGAILVLGSADVTHADLSSHDLAVPINLPRFWVPPGDFADDLRAGTITNDATLHADLAWQSTTCTNFYALVRPGGPPPGWVGPPPAALGITVPFDAGCLVPDLAPGASSAVQTACGLALLRDLAQHPLDRPVLVCFTGGDSLNMLASRTLHLTLSDVPSTWAYSIHLLDQRKTALTVQLRRASEIVFDPSQLNPIRDRLLSQRLVHIVQLQASALQDRLFEMRTATPAPFPGTPGEGRGEGDLQRPRIDRRSKSPSP